jgi:hypothetical protein
MSSGSGATEPNPPTNCCVRRLSCADDGVCVQEWLHWRFVLGWVTRCSHHLLCCLPESMLRADYHRLPCTCRSVQRPCPPSGAGHQAYERLRQGSRRHSHLRGTEFMAGCADTSGAELCGRAAGQQGEKRACACAAACVGLNGCGRCNGTGYLRAAKGLGKVRREGEQVDGWLLLPDMLQLRRQVRKVAPSGSVYTQCHVQHGKLSLCRSSQHASSLCSQMSGIAPSSLRILHQLNVKPVHAAACYISCRNINSSK